MTVGMSLDARGSCEIQVRVIRLAIDQHQIGFDVAIAMVQPFVGKGMVPVTLGQWSINDQKCEHLPEFIIKIGAMAAF
jgi:uncharacterized protein YtpQ (UPF0354 family)